MAWIKPIPASLRELRCWYSAARWASCLGVTTSAITRLASGTSGNRAVQLGLQVALAAKPNNLLGDLAVLEKQQGRHRRNAILARKVLGYFDAHLADFQFARVFTGQLIQHRGQHLAGRTIFPPKIHQDRHGS